MRKTADRAKARSTDASSHLRQRAVTASKRRTTPKGRSPPGTVPGVLSAAAVTHGLPQPRTQESSCPAGSRGTSSPDQLTNATQLVRGWDLHKRRAQHRLQCDAPLCRTASIALVDRLAYECADRHAPSLGFTFELRSEGLVDQYLKAAGDPTCSHNSGFGLNSLRADG